MVHSTEISAYACATLMGLNSYFGGWAEGLSGKATPVSSCRSQEISGPQKASCNSLSDTVWDRCGHCLENLLRQLGIGHAACKDHSADQSRKHNDRVLPPNCLCPSRYDARDQVNKPRLSLHHRFFDRRRLTPKFAAESRKQATGLRVILVSGGQIVFCQSLKRVSRRLVDDLFPLRCCVIHGSLRGQTHQFFLGFEVPVEPTMGQTYFFHQFGDADAIESVLPKPFRSGLDDLLPML